MDKDRPPIEERKYRTTLGTNVTLLQLIKIEPEWAKSCILSLERQLKEVKEILYIVRSSKAAWEKQCREVERRVKELEGALGKLTGYNSACDCWKIAREALKKGGLT